MSVLPKIGIDIGSSAIKLVELVPAGNKWRFVSAASMPTTSGVTVEGSNIPAVASAISGIIKEAGMRTRRAVVALPEEQVSSHVIELPILKDAEIAQALEWQVEQYIPIPKEQATWSWEIVRKDEVSGGMEVLLVAASKSLVENYKKIVEQAGLELAAVETELTATARAMVGQSGPLTMIIDIGAKSTDLGIVRSGQLIATRTLPTAGEAFSRAIESTLALDPKQAEQYRNTYGFTAGQLEGKLAAAMQPVLAVVAGEVKKMTDFYVSKHPGEIIKSAVLSGGVAAMPNIVTSLSAILGIETIIGDPFANLIMDEVQRQAFANNGPFYGVAIGLAMREI